MPRFTRSRRRSPLWNRLAVACLATLMATACASSPATTPAPPEAAAPAAPAAPATPPSPPAAERMVPPFKFIVATQGYNPEDYEAGVLVTDQLKALGMRPEVVTYPTFQAYTDMWKKLPDWGIGSSAYTPREDRLDPDELLKFRTCAEANEGGLNEGGYCSPDFDRAYADQARVFDPAQRKPHVLKAEEILARDLPAMATMHLFVRHAYNQDKYANVVSVPGIGTWNIMNFIQATPRTGDRVLRASYVGALPALNPMANSFAGVTQDVIRLIYDTLTRPGADGTPQPAAAEKWQQVDDKTLDLTLRPGMKFHDGRPVTADDVVFTISYFLKTKPAWYVAYLRPLDRAEKTGDRTVRLYLKSPYAPLLLTTLGRLPILPRHIWESIADPTKVPEANLIGSGPYKMKTQNVEQSYRLVRNDDYFAPPKSDEAMIIRFANKETQFLALAKGDAYFLEPKGLAPNQVAEARKVQSLKVIIEPSIDVRYLVFNMKDKSPFQDHNLRLAVAHLVDFTTIEKVIGKDMAEAGQGFIAPANKFYHNDNLPSRETDGPHRHQYDPKKARQILQSAGYEWDQSGRLYFPKNFKPKLLPN